MALVLSVNARGEMFANGKVVAPEDYGLFIDKLSRGDRSTIEAKRVYLEEKEKQ